MMLSLINVKKFIFYESPVTFLLKHENMAVHVTLEVHLEFSGIPSSFKHALKWMYVC